MTGSASMRSERYARKFTPSIREDSLARVFEGRDDPSRKCYASRARITATVPMGAFEYTALDSLGRSRKGVIEGDTARHVRSLPARAPIAAGHDRRSRAGGITSSPATPRPCAARTGRVGGRSGLADAKALDLGARGPAGLEEALLAVTQQTEKPRVQSIVLGVRVKSGRGPYAGGRPRRLPACLPGDLSRHRVSRRAVGPPGQCAKAARRVRERPRAECFKKSLGATALSPISTDGHVLRHRVDLADLRGAKVIEVFQSNHAKLPLATTVLVVMSLHLRTVGADRGHRRADRRRTP